MGEAFPILAGVVVGGGLALVFRRLPLLYGLSIAVVLGALATFVTGEWRTSWAFVLFDIPLVAACSAGGFVATRSLLTRLAARREHPQVE